MQSERSRVARM